MHIGFDYGTANCAVAHLVDDQPQLIPLENNQPYIASALAAPNRESVCEFLTRHMDIPAVTVLQKQRLMHATQFNFDEGIRLSSSDVQFGEAALKQYLDDPEETYYVKSPKSFLGVTGLKEAQCQQFEDLVCAMMRNIKIKAENHLEMNITGAMIGRPIHFQGANSDMANIQAQGILERAAYRAGFADVDFQYEPVAAGLEFESQLTEDKCVLVIDIGGGTTDCSVLQMGPSWQSRLDRSSGILAHSGERVGGNDLDIHLAYHKIMPWLGSGTLSHKGQTLPMVPFWQAIAINDVAAQTDFYAKSYAYELEKLRLLASEPEKITRLMEVQKWGLGHRLVRNAEEAKVALSSAETFETLVSVGKETWQAQISEQDLRVAIARPMEKIQHLIHDVLRQSARMPDVVFITGGSAHSPIVKAMISTALPNVPQVTGSYFGSVTSGLARWADRVFS
jgi:hypothetical chaperone protein